MAKILAFLAFILSILYAGDPNAESETINPYRAIPEIILKNTKIGAELTYNGQLVKLGEMTINDLEKILGKENRLCNNSRGCWVWDNLGIRLYERSFKEQADRDKNIIDTLTVDINQMPPLNDREYRDYELPGHGIHPKEFFKGYLEIDGVRIHKNMTIKSLNAKLKTIKPFYCGQISICSTTISIGNMWIGIQRDTLGNKYNSLIYDMQFIVE
jgi:hypothetical protein